MMVEVYVCVVIEVSGVSEFNFFIDFGGEFIKFVINSGVIS